MNEYKAYRIEWIDSQQYEGWVMKEEILRKSDVANMEVSTIGFLLYEDDKIIITADSISKNCVNSPMTIPKIAIVSMIEIVGYDPEGK